MEELQLLFGLLFLVPAGWIDFRTREVPDLISYGFILFAICYRLVEAFLSAAWQPILAMLAGGGSLLVLGTLLYRAGQWGGADAKLLAGVGALLGLWFGQTDALGFLVALLLAGAAYGLIFVIYLAAANRHVFQRHFLARLRELALARKLVIGTCLLLFLGILVAPLQLKRPLFLLLLLSYLLFYIWVAVTVVERKVLIKRYPVGKLTEGDWINEEVRVKGKLIVGPKSLGISTEQIAALRRLRVKSVVVKEGIPFVPSFLFAFLLLWWFGGWF